jgi:hypothetical protein
VGCFGLSAGGACAAVVVGIGAMEDTDLKWRKASHSSDGGGNCVDDKLNCHSFTISGGFGTDSG